MFMPQATAFLRADPVAMGSRRRDRHPTMPNAFAASALIETETGWCVAGALEPGMALQTRDGGLCRLDGVERHSRWPIGGAEMVRVPGGAIGNCRELSLLPETRLLVGLHGAEDLIGVDEVLVAAGALDGWRGIRTETLAAPEALVSLRFADEEVIWLNTGVQVYCGRGTGYWTELDGPGLRALLAGAAGQDQRRAA